MRKSITAALIFVILAVSLCACGAQGRPATATEDKDFQKVFNYLEEGEYLKAQEFFEKNITGNLEKEDAAWEEFYSYKNAVLQDMSSGNLSLDEATSIYEAGIRAGFETYFSDFETQLNAMQNSMVCFDDGINCFNSADYENAYLNLVQVLPQDVNYGEALETIYKIAIESSDSDVTDDLLLSEKCFKLIERSQENYMVSELETDGELHLLQMLHDVTLKSAEALQAENWPSYAAAQYANAAGYSNRLQTLADNPEEWFNRQTEESEQYSRIIRECNILADDLDSYYILTENGIDSTRYELTESGIEAVSGSPSFTTSATDYIQLVMTSLGTSGRGGFGVLDKFGNIKFGITNTSEQYYDWVALKDYSGRNTDGWNIPIKINLSMPKGSPDALVLYSDGTIDFYSVDPFPSYFEMQNYGDIADFIQINRDDDFVVLRKSGHVNCTSEYWWMDFSDWPEITQITVGTANPEGYGSFGITHDYIYGLDKDGVIHYKRIIHDEDEAESGRIPENGTIVLNEPVIKISGSAYLTQSGILGSMEPLLNDWLLENYGNYRFSSIARANSSDSYIYRDMIAATTTEGEIFIIELGRTREFLR